MPLRAGAILASMGDLRPLSADNFRPRRLAAGPVRLSYADFFDAFIFSSILRRISAI